jgi:hypothetical protein
MKKEKTYMVLVLEEEDTPPVIKRMTKKEVIEFNELHGRDGWMLIDGDILKTFDSQFQVKLL